MERPRSLAPSEVSDVSSGGGGDVAGSWAGSVAAEKLRPAPGDACYVTSRIIAAPMPTADNVSLVCRWLLAETGPNFLLWDLSDDADEHSKRVAIWSGLTGRVVRGRLQEEAGPHEVMLTQVLRNLAAMHSWLELDPANRCVVCCRNGRTRTGLMLACLLRYAGVFESSFDGLAHFYRRRAPDTYASMERAGVEIVDNEPATTRMLLSNFDVALSVGGPPNGTALRLDRVRITGMAALGAGDASLDLPSLELYTRGDAYRVTSGGRLEACVSLSADAGTVTIDVPNHVPILHEDFAVTSRVPRIGNAASGKRLLFRYANNKGFLAPGTITLDTEGVDVSRNLIKTLADDFTVELLLSEHDGSVKSFTPFAVESTPQHQRRRSSIRNSDFARMLEARAALDAMPADEERRSSAWSTTTTTSDEEDDGEYPPWQALRGGIDERLLGMQELQWRHIVQANQGNIDELAACGYDTTAAELALQLCANDTESAAATAQSIMAMNGVPLALTSPSPPERGRRSFMERGRRSFMGAPFSGGRGSTLSMEPARRERVSSFEPRSPGDASTPPPRDISSPAAGTLATGGRKKLSVPKTAPLARSGAARRDALASASNRASMQLLKTGTLPRGVSIAALSASPPKSADAARTEAIESMIAEVAQEDGVTLDEIRDLIMAKKAQKVVEGHKWPPDGPVLKRGLLMKKDRRKVLNRWQERDFVLTAAVLGYASHKENIKKGDKSERSVFALEELKEVSTSPTDGRVLMLRVGMESPITVRAPTAEDAQEWQYAIDSARGQAGERVFGRNPLMEGINSRNMRMHALSRLAGNDPASPISQASPVLSEGKSPGVANAGDPRQRDVVSPLHNLMPGTAVTNLSSKFEQQQQSPPPPPASPESEQGETTPQGSSYAVDPLASAASAGESANVAVPSLATASPKEDSRAALSALLTKHEDKPSPSSSESAFADEVKDHAGEGPTIKAEVKKFVMMLKAGVSRSAVEFKMQNDGMDVAELDDEAVVRFLEAALQPEEEPPQAASLDDLPPEHRRFVAMIKAGVPRPAVEHKMRADNVDPIFLDSEVVRKILGGMKKTAAADDDERYNKYKMMFKNGVPLGAVQSKMALDGLDPEALREWFASAAGDDKLDPSSTAGPGRRRIVKKKQDAAVATWKRRTLAWKEVKVDKDRETIWNEGSVNINLNDDELADFQALFKADPSKGGGAAADSSPDGEGGAPRKKPPRRVMANLIDPRRATNAGIAIKNLRIPHAEVREHILALNTRAFTAVQLSLLIEYWPTPDERTLLKGYRGDEESLNEAEVFMRGISDVCQGPARLRAMLFQSTFDEKLAGVTRDLESLEDACDDVRLSNRLRVLLRVVLQLGNKVNEDSAEAFTLDSLLKLSSAKSKDLKTSVLDYLVMLAERWDPDLLRFSEDLSSSVPASRVLVNECKAELKVLQRGLTQAVGIAKGRSEQKKGVVQDAVNRLETGDEAVAELAGFCDAARERIEDANRKLKSAQEKFSGVLRYMNEQPTLSPSDFFNTLSSFIREFNGARDRVKRKHETEQRRRQMEKSMAAAASPESRANRMRRFASVGNIHERRKKSSTLQLPSRMGRAKSTMAPAPSRAEMDATDAALAYAEMRRAGLPRGRSKPAPIPEHSGGGGEGEVQEYRVYATPTAKRKGRRRARRRAAKASGDTVVL